MINFPEEFGKELRKMIEQYRIDHGIEVPEKVKRIYNPNVLFFEEELEYITYINLCKADLRYLRYLKKLDTLILDSFPSINNDDLLTIIETCPSLKTLIIKNQAGLKEADFRRMNGLKNLAIISNEHLTSVKGLENLKLESFEFYDNVAYLDVNYVIEYALDLSNRKHKVELDSLYYIDVINYLAGKIDDYDVYHNYVEECFNWNEKIGFKVQQRLSYKTGEMHIIYENVMEFIHNYLDLNASDLDKFTLIYLWMLKNIKLVDNNYANGICYGLKNNESNARSYAKILQFILRIVKIDSFDINTLPLLENNNDGIPSDDYFILRTSINDVVNYSDPAWDAKVAQTTGNISTLYMLVSKNSILLNHRIIGELSIDNNPEIPLEEKEDSIVKANKTLKKVLETNDFVMKDYTSDLMSNEIQLMINKDRLEQIGFDMMNDDMTIKEYVDLKNEANSIKRKIDANEIIIANLKSLSLKMKNVVLEQDISYIERRLQVSLKDLDKITSKKALEEKKNYYIKIVNTKKSLGILSNLTSNKLLSKIEYVFNYYLRVLNDFTAEDTDILEVINNYFENYLKNVENI